MICQQDMSGAMLQDSVIVVGSTTGPGHPKWVSFDEHSMESRLDEPICARVRPDPVRLCHHSTVAPTVPTGEGHCVPDALNPSQIAE